MSLIYDRGMKDLISTYYLSDLGPRDPSFLNIPEPDSRLLVDENGVLIGFTEVKGVPFLLNPLNMVNPHVAIIGTSGAGKSELIKTFIIEFKRANPIKPPVIVLDPQGEYLYISEALEEFGIKPVVLRVGVDTYINIFERPTEDTPYFDWVDNVVLPVVHKLGEIDSTSAAIMASRLKQVVYDLYEKSLGFRRDDPMTWRGDPTLEMLYREIDTLVERISSGAISDRELRQAFRSFVSLRDRLSRWVTGAMDFFARRGDVSLRDLMEHPVVILDYSMIQTNPVAEEVFIYYVFMYFFTMMARSPPTGGLDLVLVFDEAWTLLKRESRTKVSPIERLTRIARKYGLMVVMATQKVEDVDRSVLPLMGSVFILKLKDKQVEKVKSLDIPERLLKRLQSIDVGQAVVVPGFRFSRDYENPATPFMVRIVKRAPSPVKALAYISGGSFRQLVRSIGYAVKRAVERG